MISMSEVHWGVDGRTHRVGTNGQTLCKTMIDYSRPPEQRVVSGCEVCDIVGAGMGAPGGTGSNRGLVVAVLLALVFGLLLWAAMT
jgi:hypothetical protein